MDDDGTDPARPTRVGARLAAARLALGLELDDVAQRTRVPLRHLEAIEAGSGEGLPALTYASGFVRSYADVVGLNAAEISRAYRQEIGALPPARQAPQPYEPADPARVPPWWIAIAALIVAVIVAGSYALWRGDALFGHGDRSPAEIATTAEGVPGSSVSAPVPARPAPPAIVRGPVVLTATEGAWIKVSDGDKRLFMGVLDKGKSFQVPADAADPRLRTIRPQSLTVTVGGVARPPLGKPDQLLRAVSLAPATFGEEAAPADVRHPA